jgi:putative transposase
MRYRKSQDLLAEATNLTMREWCGKWYVIVQTERDVETPRKVPAEAGEIPLAREGCQSLGKGY